jgi:hypothetical protein
MKNRAALHAIQSLGGSARNAVRVLVVGLAILGAVITVWPWLKDWAKRRPEALRARFGSYAIRYDAFDSGLDLWRVCPSSHSNSCFTVATTPDGDVVQGADLYARLAPSDMNAAHAAHIAARILGDDASAIFDDQIRLRAFSVGGEPQEARAPSVDGDTVRYWTYTNPPGPCAARELNVRSWESKRQTYARCIEVPAGSPNESR